ncbi:hypothetical protein [Pseudomonas sp. TCU-HL1]|uniref:hypothetical protein n=1 Tax=Pseudomonas sp. TCU-HL1 TaxID=1856685 RepID=UPI0011AB7248|nr:hypothetical protein [Pseudomonas sp. TCU-HL1]
MRAVSRPWLKSGAMNSGFHQSGVTLVLFKKRSESRRAVQVRLASKRLKRQGNLARRAFRESSLKERPL